MAISLFERRSMARALIEMKPVRTFLRNTFFGTRVEFDVEHVDVDVMKGARRLAPFVNPNLPGTVVDRQGFTTHTYAAPNIGIERPTTAADLLTRRPGEDVYEAVSPEQRAAEILGMDLAEIDEMIARREEWMCAQALFTDSIRILGPGVDETINFGRSSDNEVPLMAEARRWTASTAKIVTDLMDWRRIITKSGAPAPTLAILGSEAADALLHNSKLAEMLDVKDAYFGQLAPEIREADGITYLGRIPAAGVDLVSYDEWYIDPTTLVETPMVPPKKVLLGSPRVRTELRYGAVPVASGTDGDSTISLVRGQRVPDSWVTKSPAVRWVKVSSRPLPIPIQVDGFLVADVVV